MRKLIIITTLCTMTILTGCSSSEGPNIAHWDALRYTEALAQERVEQEEFDIEHASIVEEERAVNHVKSEANKIALSVSTDTSFGEGYYEKEEVIVPEEMVYADNEYIPQFEGKYDEAKNIILDEIGKVDEKNRLIEEERIRHEEENRRIIAEHDYQKSMTESGGQQLIVRNKRANQEYLSLTERYQLILGSDKPFTTLEQYGTVVETYAKMTRVSVHTWSEDKDGNLYDKEWKVMINTHLKEDFVAIMNNIFEHRPQVVINKFSTYNRRTIRGSSTPSNHSYGVAVDFNYDQNPMCKRTGIPASYQPGIDPLCIDENHPIYLAFDEYDWGWGGHYPNTPDFMHFEYFKSDWN